MEKTDEINVNLASGTLWIKGWINVDNKSQYEGDFPVDLEADILTLDYPENTVDRILLCHFAMYMSPKEMKEQVTKWYKWLKPGGFLTIETGDIKKIAELIVSSKNPDIINGQDGVRQLYGEETTVGHKWAWCKETLTPILKGVGFNAIESHAGGLHVRPERDFTITAWK